MARDYADWISIHAPREGSDSDLREAGETGGISIHAPREGSDIPSTVFDNPELLFLSTLPARGATGVHGAQHGGCLISIHAPREGSDPTVPLPAAAAAPNFYPRSPRGERRQAEKPSA